MEKSNDLVIFNSSPLINLAKIDSLNLIEKIYQEVIIPEAVHEEVLVAGENKENTKKISNLIDENIIKIKKVSNQELVKSFRIELDYGEAEVLALAIECNASLVIIDEIEARNVAEVYDIPKTGFIGVLIKADELGLVESGMSLLDTAIKSGFRISNSLYEHVKNILE